jgi:hypothetical protein
MRDHLLHLNSLVRSPTIQILKFMMFLSSSGGYVWVFRFLRVKVRWLLFGVCACEAEPG